MLCHWHIVCDLGDGGPGAAWNHTQLPEVSAALARLLPPFDDVFINSGLWQYTPFRANLSTAMDQLRGFTVKNASRTPTWLTTTRRSDFHRDPWAIDNRDTDGYGTEAAVELGWEVIDRRAMTVLLFEKMLELTGHNDTFEGVQADAAMLRSYAWADYTHLQAYVNNEMNNVLLNKLCENAGVHLDV